MLTVPRDVCRALPLSNFRSGGDISGDGRTFTGYGAVFNSPTRIDSWEGTFDEQVAPGAFVKSLREFTPKFQFDHGRHPLIGSVPIGVITDIHEDSHGLFVESRMGQHMFIDFVREAIETGAVNGMSFRFEVIREEWRDAKGKRVAPEDVRRILYYGEQPERAPLFRTLKELRMPEVGPVTWPAYTTTTASVRSHQAPTLSRAIARRRMQLLQISRKAS